MKKYKNSYSSTQTTSNTFIISHSAAIFSPSPRRLDEVHGNGKVGEAVKIHLIFGAYENQERLKGKALNFLSEFTVYVLDPAGKRQDLKLTQTETA